MPSNFVRPFFFPESVFCFQVISLFICIFILFIASDSPCVQTEGTSLLDLDSKRCVPWNYKLLQRDYSFIYCAVVCSRLNQSFILFSVIPISE